MIGTPKGDLGKDTVLIAGYMITLIGAVMLAKAYLVRVGGGKAQGVERRNLKHLIAKSAHSRKGNHSEVGGKNWFIIN